MPLHSQAEILRVFRIHGVLSQFMEEAEETVNFTAPLQGPLQCALYRSSLAEEKWTRAFRGLVLGSSLEPSLASRSLLDPSNGLKDGPKTFKFPTIYFLKQTENNANILAAL